MRTSSSYVKLHQTPLSPPVSPSTSFSRSDFLVAIISDLFSPTETQLSLLQDAIIKVTIKRIEVQRLCNDMGLDEYYIYNNPKSLEEIRQLRTEILRLISSTHQELVDLDKQAIELNTRERRETYLQVFKEIVIRFTQTLEQLRQDSKDICSEYREYVTRQYNTINPRIPLLECLSFIRNEKSRIVLNNDSKEVPYCEEIMHQMVFRREDMHSLMEIIKLINKVIPALKLFEHRLALSSIQRTYRDQEDDFDSDMDFSDDEDVLSQPSLTFWSRWFCGFGNSPDNSGSYKMIYLHEPLVDSHRRHRSICFKIGNRTRRCQLSKTAIECCLGLGLVLVTLGIMIFVLCLFYK